MALSQKENETSQLGRKPDVNRSTASTSALELLQKKARQTKERRGDRLVRKRRYSERAAEDMHAI